MKPFTECRILNFLSLASSPKQTVSDEEFSSSYT
ncbi:RteC protein, partial [Escherichia coli]|nr:RteC protein [Escherichia coli]